MLEELKNILSEYIIYFWFIILAMIGGTVKYLSRLKTKNLPFSLLELIMEWVISGFAGIITMYVCLWQGYDLHLTAVLVGITGHMGGSGIALIQESIMSAWKNRLGVQISKEGKNGRKD